MPIPKYVVEDSLVGRTIAKVLADGEILLIRFADGTFSSWKVGGEEGCELIENHEPDNLGLLRDAGVLTDAEYSTAHAERQAEATEQLRLMQEERRLWEAECEKRREEYAALRLSGGPILVVLTYGSSSMERRFPEGSVIGDARGHQAIAAALGFRGIVEAYVAGAAKDDFTPLVNGMTVDFRDTRWAK